MVCVLTWHGWRWGGLCIDLAWMELGGLSADLAGMDLGCLCTDLALMELGWSVC